MSALSTALYALTAAQGIAGAAGQRQQARGVIAQGAYQSAADETNARLATARARDAVARGAAAEREFRRGTRGLVGTQRAVSAANGVMVDDGSALDLNLDAETLGELDALTIRNNAAREAWGFQTEATSYRARAAMARLAARQAAGALRGASIGTLLTTGATLVGMYKDSRDRSGGSTA